MINGYSIKIKVYLDCPICGNSIYENTDLYSKKKKYRCKSCQLIFSDIAIERIKHKMEIRKRWIELSR